MNIAKLPIVDNIVFLSLILLATACAPVITTGDSATSSSGTSNAFPASGIYEDAIYSDKIETVQLIYQNEPLPSSAVPLSRSLPLTVTFDELEEEGSEDYTQYNFQLIHCNADWTKSRLFNVDYLYEYNDYAINNEEFSYNTKVPFIHFTFNVPQVKASGNYAIKVYRGDDENDVVFVKRLMVYDAAVGIAAEVARPDNVNQRDIQHRINFEVSYGDVNITNPLNDVFVVIRQNYQWFNAIEGLEPTQVQQFDKVLYYEHFNGQNAFYAGNEYRYFDIRTINAYGQNIGEINRDAVPFNAFVLPDKNRSTEAYSQYQEQNGGFFINNLEAPQGDVLNSDYLNTHFFLRTDQKVEGDVYVIGGFNNRVLSSENKMTYDEASGGYMVDVLLKQGFYNYLYYVDADPGASYTFEGNHFQTENVYDIFVYVRPIGGRADFLLGYTRISSGQQ